MTSGNLVVCRLTSQVNSKPDGPLTDTTWSAGLDLPLDLRLTDVANGTTRSPGKRFQYDNFACIYQHHAAASLRPLRQRLVQTRHSYKAPIRTSTIVSEIGTDKYLPLGTHQAAEGVPAVCAPTKETEALLPAELAKPRVSFCCTYSYNAVVLTLTLVLLGNLCSRKLWIATFSRSTVS